MIPDDTYGVLLVSFSRHSHQHSFVPLYLAHPRIRIVAVAEEPDADPALRTLNARWAKRLGVPYLENVDQALERRDVHIVSLAHEIERRAGLAVRAAQAGKHLWIDKFMGRDLAECDVVIAAVDQAGVQAIIPSYDYGDLLERGARAAADPRLGQLLGLHADIFFGKGWPRPPAVTGAVADAGEWKYPDLKRELLTVGSYAVALIQRCLGPIRLVLGCGGAHFFPAHAARSVEDFATLTLVDDAGRIATLGAGRVGVAAHPAGGPSRAWLVGTRSTAVTDARRPAVDHFLRDELAGADFHPSPDDPMQWASGPPAQATPLGRDGPGLTRALEDLVAAIDGVRPPAFGPRHARAHLEILLAGYRALATGLPVPVPLEEAGP
ncbi:MAG: Gfo/Idh/MocA family oxidoreductase [Gemmatimonadota bacterium]